MTCTNSIHRHSILIYRRGLTPSLFFIHSSTICGRTYSEGSHPLFFAAKPIQLWTKNEQIPQPHRNCEQKMNKILSRNGNLWTNYEQKRNLRYSHKLLHWCSIFISLYTLHIHYARLVFRFAHSTSLLYLCSILPICYHYIYIVTCVLYYLCVFYLYVYITYMFAIYVYCNH